VLARIQFRFSLSALFFTIQRDTVSQSTCAPPATAATLHSAARLSSSILCTHQLSARNVLTHLVRTALQLLTTTRIGESGGTQATWDNKRVSAHCPQARRGAGALPPSAAAPRQRAAPRPRGAQAAPAGAPPPCTGSRRRRRTRTTRPAAPRPGPPAPPPRARSRARGTCARAASRCAGGEAGPPSRSGLPLTRPDF